MAHSFCMLVFTLVVYFLGESFEIPLGETSINSAKEDPRGNTLALKADINTNIFDKLGAGQKVKVKLQLPDVQVDPNIAKSFSWDPSKLPDIFKGFDDMGSSNGDISLGSNSLEEKFQLPPPNIDQSVAGAFNWDPPKLPDIFKGFDSLKSLNGSLSLGLNSLGDKLQRPFLQVDPNVAGTLEWNPTRVPDFFNSFLSFNGSLSSNSNSFGDLFKDFNARKLPNIGDILNGKKDPNFITSFLKDFSKWFSNLKQLKTDPNFMGSFTKIINCLLEFTKSLNLDMKPLQDFVKGLEGSELPSNLIDNVTKGLSGFKIDSNLLNIIASWINNLNLGIQIDPLQIEELLGGIEGLEEINVLLSPIIEALVGGLGVIDSVAIGEALEGILALLLLI